MKVIHAYNRQLDKISDRNWLILRFAVFPLMAIVPFLLSSNAAPICQTLHYVGNGMYEQGAYLPKQNPIYSILSVAILLFFAIVSLRAKKPRPHAQRKKYILRQIGVSAAAIAITIPLYIFVYNHSLSAANISWDFDSNCHSIGHWPKTAFGFGMSWQVLVALALFYILVPLIAYYRLFLSRRHIGDIKKKELFQ